MRWSLVLVLVLLVLSLTDAAKKKKKPSKGKKPKPVKGSCATVGPKLTAANTKKYTAPGKCPCWWDITRNDCACCKKNVGAMQCGFPMHKFCYKKSDLGCPGVCNNRYTLSGKGYPCFSDHSDTDCAWCAKDGYQCAQDSVTGPNSKYGSRCQTKTNVAYCKSQQGDCKHIAKCDINAECKYQSKVGKFGKYFACKCNSGFTGNGIQCMDADGNLSSNPGATVELTMTLTTEEYEGQHEAGQFSHGAGMESLLSQMETTGSACTGEECEATYNMVQN